MIQFGWFGAVVLLNRKPTTIFDKIEIKITGPHLSDPVISCKSISYYNLSSDPNPPAGSEFVFTTEDFTASFSAD